MRTSNVAEQEMIHAAAGLTGIWFVGLFFFPIRQFVTEKGAQY